MSNRKNFVYRRLDPKFAIARLALVVVIVILAAAVIGAAYYYSTLSTSSTMSSTVASTQQSTQTTTTEQSTQTTATGSTPSSSIQGQTGNLSLLLTDPPNFPANVTSAYVYYSEIEIHRSGVGNQTGWYMIAHPNHVSVVDLGNFSLTVGRAAVQSGTFDMIRFHIMNATVTYNGVNYTAYVHGDELVVPIVGGVAVPAGGSSGLLMDLSSNVVPYQNGTSVGFIFASNALCYPFPSQSWHDSYGMMGHRTDMGQEGWWHDAWSHSVGNITIASASLTSNSLSVTVRNTGSSNVTLFLLSLLYANSTFQNHMSGCCDHSWETDHMSYNDFHMFTAFNILSNGTLVQMSHDFEPEHFFQSGLVLGPNQSTTITFNGPIVLMHDHYYNANAPGSIVSGQQYIITVISNLGIGASMNVTAG